LQDQEVGQVQQHAPGQEGDAERADLGPLDGDDVEGEGRVEQAGQRLEEPDEAGTAAGALGEEVPGGVGDGGEQDEGEGDGRHGGSFTPPRFRGATTREPPV
jgi:hypothetical protein